MGSIRYRLCYHQRRTLRQGGPSQVFQTLQLFIFRQAGSPFDIQLNMYNFHKIRENSQESYFHHECFNSSDRDALADIKRKPEKKKKKGAESDEENCDS